MSTWFSSYIIYGVKLSYDIFEEKIGDKIWEDDKLRIENNPDGIGWSADGMNGDYAIFGKLILSGSDNGNDTPLGGDGEVTRVPLLVDEEKQDILQRIEVELGKQYVNQADYFVVGEYS